MIFDDLKRIRELDEKIDKTLEQISNLEDVVTSTTTAMSDMKVQTTPNPQRMSEYSCVIIDLKNEVDKMTDDLVDLKRNVCDFLASHLGTDSSEYKVIYYRFVCLVSRTKTAKKLHYSREGIRQIEIRGIRKIRTIENRILAREAEIERTGIRSEEGVRTRSEMFELERLKKRDCGF